MYLSKVWVCLATEVLKLQVVSFITNAGDLSTASKLNLLELLSNPIKSTQL